jgi:hypothetical protein
MIFFDVRAAVAKLKSGPLSAHESFKYLTGVLIVSTLDSVIRSSQEFIFGKPEKAAIAWSDFWVEGLLLLLMAMLAIGIGYFLILRPFYWSNGGGKGRDLIARLLVLGWVFGFRAALVVVPAILVTRLFNNGREFGLLTGLSLLLLFGIVIGALIYIIVGVNRCLREIYAFEREALAGTTPVGTGSE